MAAPDVRSVQIISDSAAPLLGLKGFMPRATTANFSALRARTPLLAPDAKVRKASRPPYIVALVRSLVHALRLPPEARNKRCAPVSHCSTKSGMPPSYPPSRAPVECSAIGTHSRVGDPGAGPVNPRNKAPLEQAWRLHRNESTRRCTMTTRCTMATRGTMTREELIDHLRALGSCSRGLMWVEMTPGDPEQLWRAASGHYVDWLCGALDLVRLRGSPVQILRTANAAEISRLREAKREQEDHLWAAFRESIEVETEQGLTHARLGELHNALEYAVARNAADYAAQVDRACETYHQQLGAVIRAEVPWQVVEAALLLAVWRNRAALNRKS